MTEMYFVNYYQSKNREQSCKIKKLLYKAIRKCRIKTPRRAPASSLCFLTVWGRWKWIISAIWMAYFILFLLYNKSEKKIMTYICLQLNLPSPSIQASTFLAGPPLHPPLSMCTSWMNAKGITATKSYIH